MNARARGLCTLVAGWMLIGIAGPASAIDATLRIETAVQGLFPGENTAQGREDTIQILGYAQRHNTPYDPGTGQVLGGPQCGPLVVRKLVDRTTPLFAQAWFTNEQTSTFVLRFYDSGTPYFQIELTNAVITSISRAGAEGDGVPSEQITLIYQSITYEHLGAATTAQLTCFGGAGS